MSRIYRAKDRNHSVNPKVDWNMNRLNTGSYFCRYRVFCVICQTYDYCLLKIEGLCELDSEVGSGWNRSRKWMESKVSKFSSSGFSVKSGIFVLAKVLEWSRKIGFWFGQLRSEQWLIYSSIVRPNALLLKVEVTEILFILLHIY